MRKSSNIKYLGCGFISGAAIAITTIIGLALVFFGGAAMSPILPQPTNTRTSPSIIIPAETSTMTPAVVAFTPTMPPTFTLTPTFVYLTPPTSTATLTVIEQKIANGEIAIMGGALTQMQQIQLYNASTAFIAQTTEESIQKGESVAGKGYGSPTLICGPLSIAILQSAGLLNPEIVPFDFWLLNPAISKDRKLIDRVFPPERYEHYDVKTPINEFNFSDFPLMPGDFLYVRHGSYGNFDHFMVVNRVDAAGRAYSVTNHNTERGFIINETAIYDPNDSSVGIFYQWTKKKYAVDGATGYGGFELWRLRAP